MASYRHGGVQTRLASSLQNCAESLKVLYLEPKWEFKLKFTKFMFSASKY
jgi:hypothetical protein